MRQIAMMLGVFLGILFVRPSLTAPAQLQLNPEVKFEVPATSDAPCIAEALDPDIQQLVAQDLTARRSLTPNVEIKDWAFVNCIVRKLHRNQFTMPPFHLYVMHTSETNYNAGAYRTGQIVVNDALLHFLNYDEDEVAAIIAHEIGHLEDFRTPVRPGGVNCIPGRRMMAWESQKCESKADYLGLQYLLGAGYNGYGMAGAFGRLLVYAGDTGLHGFLLRFSNTHPINIDRLKAVRAEWIELCQQHSMACQNTTP